MFSGCVLLFCNPMCRGKREGATGRERAAQADEKTAASKKKVNKTKRRRGTLKLCSILLIFGLCVSLSAPCFTADRSFVSFHYEFKVWRVKTRFPRLAVYFRSNTEERRCSVFFATASGLTVNWQKSIRTGRPERIKIGNFFCSVYYFCDKYPATIRPMGVSSKVEVCGNLCQCQANYSYNDSSSKASKDNLFSPIKKMKVLKKIKKRMGLGRLRSVPLRWLITAADPKFPEWSFRAKKERPQENCKDLIMIRQLRLHFSGGERCASWERSIFPWIYAASTRIPLHSVVCSVYPSRLNEISWKEETLRLQKANLSLTEMCRREREELIVHY